MNQYQQGGASQYQQGMGYGQHSNRYQSRSGNNIGSTNDKPECKTSTLSDEAKEQPTDNGEKSDKMEAKTPIRDDKMEAKEQPKDNGENIAVNGQNMEVKTPMRDDNIEVKTPIPVAKREAAIQPVAQTVVEQDHLMSQQPNDLFNGSMLHLNFLDFELDFPDLAKFRTLLKWKPSSERFITSLYSTLQGCKTNIFGPKSLQPVEVAHVIVCGLVHVIFNIRDWLSEPESVVLPVNFGVFIEKQVLATAMYVVFLMILLLLMLFSLFVVLQ